MSNRKRVLIVGGVAGGASAAARARRLSEDAEIILYERGEYISFANCGMPYYIGGVIPERSRLLVQTPEKMQQRYRVQVHTRTEVTAIDSQNRCITVKNLADGTESVEHYDALILSPGAEPVRPPIPGARDERVFTLRNLNDMDRILQAAQKYADRRAVVVGGGYIGLEMVEALRHRGIDVTLVELAKQVFIAVDPEMAAPLHQQLELHGVDLRLGTSVTSISPGTENLSVLLNNGKSIDCGMIVLSVGVRPEVKIAREAGLEIGTTGGIRVDETMQTSDEHIYAVGDAVEVTHLVGDHSALLPLAGPANRQGRIAADNIFGRRSTYKKSQGTAICKVFDIAVAMTGLSENMLKRLGRNYEKVYVHPASHAGYYPGAAQISLKLLFDPDNGKVLGAQALGAHGADKRIDVLAVAIRAGLTVQDLSEQELCYAPPYGSAKDPVNYAGFVASNVLSGDMPVCHAQEVITPRPDQVLLDVRTPEEVKAGTIPGSRNIPLDDLRRRLEELPRDKELLVFCKVGLRGYLAARILSQKGYRCRNLSGGYTTYKHYVGIHQPEDLPGREIKQDTGETDNNTRKSSQPAAPESIEKTIDARALQCPGPIMRLKTEIDGLKTGRTLAVLAADPGFPSDVRAWCQSMNHELLSLEPWDGAFRAVVRKHAALEYAPADAHVKSRDKTLVVFSGDFDKVVASFIIANGAAAMGSRVTMFFTFWGINALRRKESVKTDKNLIERMFGWMMPRGADRLTLSRMNMAGVGTAMIKGIMHKKNVSSLPELIRSARDAGVRLVACQMSMDLMGIKDQELIEGVEKGGVAAYLGNAEKSSVNLFI